MSYTQNIKFEETGLKVSEKYTLLEVSEFMACTVKREVTLKRFEYVGEYAQYKNLLLFVVVERGKRKESNRFAKDSLIFLKGWDLNIVCDTDTEKGFKGNALINCISSEPANLRELINKNLVFGEKGLLFYSAEVLGQDSPLFPEESERIANSHAVIKQILSKLSVTA